MKIHEINYKVSQLQSHIELLKAIKQDYIEQERDSIFIAALDDGIKYISLRLEQYENADWIMME